MQLHTPQNDDALSAALLPFERVAVDTEFMRERTYFAQLCLVQIATPQDVHCMDPLAEGRFDVSWDALLAREWVLHSGRQDIEVVYQATDRMPAGIFDTQIAMGLLGYAPQVGYAGLVRELFGEELPKSHTRADWSKRPLSDAMLRYAAEDVEFLLQAHDRLSEELDRLGRGDWAREDSMALLDRSLYDVDTANAVERLKGAAKLRGRARRAAVLLAGWREQRALDSNRPRRWILKDATVLELAAKNPATAVELTGIDGMPAATAKRSGRELLALLREAESGRDDYLPPAAPDDEQKHLLKQLQRTVAGMAKELGVAAEILAPRRELAAIVAGQRDGRLFSGWRRELAADEVLAAAGLDR